jgi:hypothetical protein
MKHSTIYVDSRDVRKIINTLEKQKAFHKGELFAKQDIVYKEFSLELIDDDVFSCRIAIRDKNRIVKSIPITAHNLSFLLECHSIEIKVGSYEITIELNDALEYEEECPHCGEEVYGVTDGGLVSTCSNCGKEIMICSLCPIHCGASEDECENCVFNWLCDDGEAHYCDWNNANGCFMKRMLNNIGTF